MPGNERVWTTAEVLRRTGRSPEPGELFWFLYDEWDEVLERQASGRLFLDSIGGSAFILSLTRRARAGGRKAVVIDGDEASGTVREHHPSGPDAALVAAGTEIRRLW